MAGSPVRLETMYYPHRRAQAAIVTLLPSELAIAALINQIKRCVTSRWRDFHHVKFAAKSIFFDALAAGPDNYCHLRFKQRIEFKAFRRRWRFRHWLQVGRSARLRGDRRRERQRDAQQQGGN